METTKMRLCLIAVSVMLIVFGRWQIKRKDGDFMAPVFGVIYLCGGSLLLLIGLVAPLS